MSQLNSVQSSPSKSHSMDSNPTLEAILEELKDDLGSFTPLYPIVEGFIRDVFVI